MNKDKIFVIDDDPVFIKLVSALLKARRYDVITAFDGVEGLEKAIEEQPNLVILDISMPTISGYKVCEKLKTNKNTKKIPVVMLTAEKDTEAIEKAYQVGADDYIIKPINLSILVNKIDRLLSKHKS